MELTEPVSLSDATVRDSNSAGKTRASIGHGKVRQLSCLGSRGEINKMYCLNYIHGQYYPLEVWQQAWIPHARVCNELSTSVAKP